MTFSKRGPASGVREIAWILMFDIKEVRVWFVISMHNYPYQYSKYLTQNRYLLDIYVGRLTVY